MEDVIVEIKQILSQARTQKFYENPEVKDLMAYYQEAEKDWMAGFLYQKGFGHYWIEKVMKEIYG